MTTTPTNIAWRQIGYRPVFAGITASTSPGAGAPAYLTGFAASYGDPGATGAPDRGIRQAVRFHLDCCQHWALITTAALDALRSGDEAAADRWFGRMSGLIQLQSALCVRGNSTGWRSVWNEAQASWAQVIGVAQCAGILPSPILQRLLATATQREHIFPDGTLNIPLRVETTRRDLAMRVLEKVVGYAEITPINGGLRLVAFPLQQQYEPHWSVGIPKFNGVSLNIPLQLDENAHARALFALLNWTYEPDGAAAGIIRFHEPDLPTDLPPDFESRYASTVGEVQ